MQATLPRAGWPSLDWASWRDTATTLHRWTQIVGKIQLATAPWVNHWWHVTQRVTPTGLTTGPLPWGDRRFAVDFDLVRHQLRIVDSRGASRTLRLEPRSVADLYRELFARLRELGIGVRIWPRPVELADTTPLDRDEHHASYDRDAVGRFFEALSTADRLMRVFRGEFVGKCSPVHFFWGSFDHAVTRFSGRSAPPHPGNVPNLADVVTREAYSRELTSCGFWPGGDHHPEPLFYAYAYPAPAGFGASAVRPATARFADDLQEFVLPWDRVRHAEDPDEDVLAFFRSTYAAAADLGRWDRAALERPRRTGPSRRRA